MNTSPVYSTCYTQWTVSCPHKQSRLAMAATCTQILEVGLGKQAGHETLTTLGSIHQHAGYTCGHCGMKQEER